MLEFNVFFLQTNQTIRCFFSIFPCPFRENSKSLINSPILQHLVSFRKIVSIFLSEHNKDRLIHRSLHACASQIRQLYRSFPMNQSERGSDSHGEKHTRSARFGRLHSPCCPTIQIESVLIAWRLEFSLKCGNAGKINQKF